ncbi:AAA family ATPase [Myroides odoratus]|uniref:AAA family ATPase n=1 Tax=Myroides odoratus TaxID=256 RepID=UPI0039B079FC
MMHSFYIFTGGPGSGKSAVLEALATLGYTVVPEVGRALIKQQIQNQGEALPWKNKQLFFEQMFRQSLFDYHQNPSDRLTFFDRGLLDSIGYAHLENLNVTVNQLASARETTYAKTVFIFPPWEAIYQQDAERKQAFEVAVETHKVMQLTYEFFGYQLIEIPCLSIEKRVEFIVEYLDLNY